MNLRDIKLHPDYHAIEQHVRLARLQRSVALGEAIASLLVGAAHAARGLLGRIRAAQPGARHAAAVYARTAGF